MAGLVAVTQGLVARVQEQPLVALLVTLVVICVTTRLTTGQSEGSQTTPQLLDAKTPPAVPYWIPYLGHIPQMALNSTAFLTRLRKLHPGGAFSLTVFGGTHTVLFRPALNAALVGQSAHSIDGGPAEKHLIKSVFGWPRSKASLAIYDTLLPPFRKQYVHLMSGDSLGQMVERTTTRLRHNIADFVTFNSGDIDQTHWERLAGAELVEGEGEGEGEGAGAGGAPVVEADLYELVRNFVAFTANGALLGTDFVENFPGFWQALWRFDAGFVSLAMDLPRLLPVSKAIGARRARGAMLRCLDELEVALETQRAGGDPGPQWADLDNVSPVIQGRVDDVYRPQGVTIPQRSVLELSLVWAMNANANPLIFWLLSRIYADADLLARVRGEVAPFVVLEQPAVGFGAAAGIHTPARIERIDLDGLMNRCPWLKAAYVESLRLDVSAWSFKSVQEDTVVGDRDAAGDAQQKFLLRAGTFAHGAHELHHTDPGAYEDPLVWRPERHIRWTTNEKGKKEPVAEMGNIRSYGGGAFMCKGRQFAIREILLFSAAIIAVYDIQPVGGGPWKLPKQSKAVGTMHPASSTRVWIKSRPLASKTSGASSS